MYDSERAFRSFCRLLKVCQERFELLRMGPEVWSSTQAFRESISDGAHEARQFETEKLRLTNVLLRCREIAERRILPVVDSIRQMHAVGGVRLDDRVERSFCDLALETAKVSALSPLPTRLNFDAARVGIRNETERARQPQAGIAQTAVNGQGGDGGQQPPDLVNDVVPEVAEAKRIATGNGTARDRLKRMSEVWPDVRHQKQAHLARWLNCDPGQISRAFKSLQWRGEKSQSRSVARASVNVGGDEVGQITSQTGDRQRVGSDEYRRGQMDRLYDYAADVAAGQKPSRKPEDVVQMLCKIKPDLGEEKAQAVVEEPALIMRFLDTLDGRAT